jgi:hypothetical protein
MKINVNFADEPSSNIVVHTGMAYEVQPVADIIVKE